MSLPIAIVASGNGTNAQAMIDLMKAGVLDVDIRLIFCNRPGAPVLERARKAGVPSRMLDHTKFPDRASFDREMASIIKESGAELVVLAGYMRLLTDDFLKEFPHRVINIHPSILPGFGGSIHAGQNIIDGGVDVLHSLLHTLAAVTGFVAIAQLQGFKFARRCAGRCHAAANGAVSQPDLSFNGGVSAGVQNFAAYNFFNFQVCHYRSILSLGNYFISSEHCSND